MQLRNMKKRDFVPWIVGITIILLAIVFVSNSNNSPQDNVSQSELSLYEQQLALCGNNICDYGEGIYLDCPSDCADYTGEEGGGRVECTDSTACPSGSGMMCDGALASETHFRCVFSEGSAGRCNSVTRRCVYPK
jgi:hypothetical protein